MTLAVVQHTSHSGSGSSVPGSLTLSSAPTAGNLLIAFVGTNINPASLTIGTGWKMFGQGNNDVGSQQGLMGLYRYVQSGDTAALPAFATAGNTYWFGTVHEISGVTGNWAIDCQTVNSYQSPGGSTSLPIPPARTAVANCLALVGFGQYDGNSVPTISTGWTLDETINDFANFGNGGAAHQAIAAANTVVTGTTTTGGTNTPVGSITLILAPSAPTTPTVRQSKMGAGNGTPGSVNFNMTPTPGNLLVAFVGWGNGNQAAPTVNATGWSEFGSALNGSDPQMLGLERYVQSGDTVTIPALCTAGSTYFTIAVHEISGVTGSWSTDFGSLKSGRQASGATIASATDSAPAGSLVLLSACNYDGNGLQSYSSGWDAVANYYDFSYLGSWGTAEQYFASAGSVNGTVTLNQTSQPAAYMQLIIGLGTTVTDALYTQIGMEVWGNYATSVEASQLGMEVWGVYESDVKATQAVIEVWSVNPSKVKVTQATVEVWRTVSGTATQLINTQLGFEVWEGFQYVPPPQVPTIVVIMGG